MPGGVPSCAAAIFPWFAWSPTSTGTSPTACMSFNYHQDAFGTKWGLTLEDGSTAHTACVGFGLERIALALFAKHGLETAEWPEDVRKALWG